MNTTNKAGTRLTDKPWTGLTEAGFTQLDSQRARELTDIYEECWNAGQVPGLFPWKLQDFEREIESGHGLAKIEQGVITAFVLMQVTADICEINMLATRTQFQRQGLMTGLLQFVISHFKDSHKLWLETEAEREGPCKLYESLGFIEVGRRPNYYGVGRDGILYAIE